MSIWQFFQDEILGMKWLNRLIGNGLSVLGLDTGGRMGGSVQFFLYDVIKITVLLCWLIFVISYIQSYLLRAAGRTEHNIIEFHKKSSFMDFFELSVDLYRFYIKLLSGSRWFIGSCLLFSTDSIK